VALGIGAASARAQDGAVVATIVAPAAPGGGWDQLARTLQRHLERGRAATRAQVENVPGAAGTVGLARFVSARRGVPDALLVTGLVMVGGIAQNASPVTLGETTPIARLVGEYEVIVVPATSPFRTLGALLAAFERDPASVSWGGGSAGGTDQILVDLVAVARGVDPRRVNYVAFSGGGEAAAALLGSQVTAGVSGLGEFSALVAEGRVRALAVSAPVRVPGVDIPTLREEGIGVDLSNWRGVVAPPGITPARRADLVTRMERLSRSPEWAAELERRGWENLFLPGDAFTRFLAAEQRRVESLVAARRGVRAAYSTVALTALPAVVGAALAILLVVVFVRSRRAAAEGARSPSVAASDGEWPARRPEGVAVVALGMVADILLIDAIGFVAAGAILFGATAFAFGERRPARIGVLAVAFAAAVYVTFRFGLDVPLPAGTLWERLR